MENTFFGNTCVSGWVYYYMKKKYNNPFIWHLILDDEDFIKVCKNFNHYMSQQPLFVDEDLKNGETITSDNVDDVRKWLIDGNQKRPFPDLQSFYAIGSEWRNVRTVSQEVIDSIPEGEPVD